MADEEAEEALNRGFIEIPVSQYEKGRYFPQYDKGQNQNFTNLPQKIYTTLQKTPRTEFTTTLV